MAECIYNYIYIHIYIYIWVCLVLFHHKINGASWAPTYNDRLISPTLQWFMAFLVEALLGPEAELTETDLKKLMVATREYSEMLDWVESTISTLLHGKIHPKDWQVLSLGDAGFPNFLELFQVSMNPGLLCIVLSEWPLNGWPIFPT